MAETDFDDIVLEDDPESEDHVRMRRSDQQKLRDAAKNSTKFRKELDEYKRRDAISAAGLTDLTPAQTAALAKLVDDTTPEALRAEAEALGWVQPAPPDPDAVTDAEIAAHSQVAAASAGATAALASRHVTPQDTAEWSSQRLMRLYEKYPQLHEELRRGNEIDLPPDFT